MFSTMLSIFVSWLTIIICFAFISSRTSLILSNWCVLNPSVGSSSIIIPFVFIVLMNSFITWFVASLYASATAVFSPPDKFSISVSYPFWVIFGVNVSFMLAFIVSSSISLLNHS